MTGTLAGKTALITGASRGLGLEIAKHFARQSANLALLARNQAALEAAASQVAQCRVDSKQVIRTYAADLSRVDELEAAFNRILAAFGGCDVLVNNAAIQGPIGSFETNPWQSWRDVFEVNLFASVRLTQLIIPSMRGRGGGKIINLSGGGAASPRPDFTAYGASKCALVRFTETLAEELRSDRIDVNAVAPGAMNTRMLDELIAAGPLATRREYPAAVERSRKSDASMESAVHLIAWLASPASDGITGKFISAAWDDWEHLGDRRSELINSNLFTLRRVT